MKEPWLAQALRTRWQLYRERLDECRKESSEEAVHELRVATRRLISQCILLGCIVPGRGPEKALRILKRQLKSLSDLRDTHVQRMAIQQQADKFPELLLVRSYLERRERQLVKSTSLHIQRLRPKPLKKWISKILAALARQTANRRVHVALTSAALRCANEAFAEAVERRRRIDPSDSRTIHRTRVAFKKFRYLVESLPPEISGLSQGDLRALASYQRRMGKIQDLEVLQAFIMRFIKRHEGTQPLLDPFCCYLRRRRARAVRSFLKSADGLLQFWPAVGLPAVVKCAPNHRAA